MKNWFLVVLILSNRYWFRYAAPCLTIDMHVAYTDCHCHLSEALNALSVLYYLCLLEWTVLRRLCHFIAVGTRFPNGPFRLSSHLRITFAHLSFFHRVVLSWIFSLDDTF